MRRMQLSVPAVACMCLWLMGCAVGLDATPTIPSPTSVPAPTLSATTAPTTYTATAPTATAVNTPTPSPPHPTATLVPPTAVPTATRRPFSPNDRVLFYREGSLWTSDLSGAAITRLTAAGFLGPDPIEDFARVFTPRVSPNGRYLTTLSRGKGSWLVSTDGREQRLIPEANVYPSWSPDSLAITYAQSDTVYIRALDDWSQRRVAARLESRPVGFAEWSPDGKWIAFLAYEPAAEVPSGAKQQLWLVRPDGTELHMLESIDALGHGPGPNEVQWGDGGRIVLAFASQPWILEPAPARRFEYPFPFYFEPPRVQSLSRLKPFGIGRSGSSSFGITFADWPEVTELRDCGYSFRRWSPDGIRAICTPDRTSRLSVETFDGQGGFTHWGTLFALPAAEDIFLTLGGDNLIFETRLEDEPETIIWHASLDPLSKARRIGRGMLFDVFRLR